MSEKTYEAAMTDAHGDADEMLGASAIRIQELEHELAAMTAERNDARNQMHRMAQAIEDKDAEIAGLKALVAATTVAKNAALEGLKRLSVVLDGEYPRSDDRHPDNDGTNALIAKLEGAQ